MAFVWKRGIGWTAPVSPAVREMESPCKDHGLPRRRTTPGGIISADPYLQELHPPQALGTSGSRCPGDGEVEKRVLEAHVRFHVEKRVRVTFPRGSKTSA